MNVAIYARVSSDIQAEQGYSLGAQIEDCKKKAEELGATLIKEYVDDGYSGAYLERPALDSLRDALRNKMFNAVICYDVDRLSRNLSHQLLITDDIETNGAKLYFVKANYEASPEGRLFYAIRGAFAGYEREKIRERSLRGKLAMLNQGKVIQDSHVYGYDFDKENHAYVVNLGEARNIKAIFARYLEDNGGTKQIVKWLNKNTDVYPPPNGKNWSLTTINSILRREMYTGKWYAHKIMHIKTGAKSEKKTLRPRSEWVEMSAPVIIDEVTFRRAGELIKRNRHVDHHKNRYPHLLQGLLYCKNCGSTLKVRSGNFRAGERAKYYTCWVDRDNGERGGCRARSVSCNALDKAVWNLLEEVCKSPFVLKAYIDSTTQTNEPQQDDTKKYARAMDKIKAERKAIMTWFSNQLLSNDEATARLKELKEQEEKLLRESVKTPPKTQHLDTEFICKTVLSCDDSPESRRAVVKQVIDKVVFQRLDKGQGYKSYKLDITLYFRQ